jgi:cytochrome P450
MPDSSRVANASELLGRAFFDDPHGWLAGLRDRAPVCALSETGVWLVSTWALIDEVLQREDDFSSHLTGVLMRGEHGRPTVFEFPQDTSGPSGVIATADEPAHAVHRSLIQPRLSPERIAALETTLRRWTRARLGPWLDTGGGDFVPIAEEIPALALARLLGLPERDVGDFRRWAMMGGDMLAGDVSRERLVALAQESGRMAEYLATHLTAAMQRPETGPDAPILHALARGVAQGAIDTPSAIGIAIVLFGAAGESTAALLGSAVRMLTERPALAARLRAEPTSIGRFVEEVVRLEPPFNFHYRSVKRACELGGVSLAAGDRLMLAWAAANRDPSVFDAPDELRLDRRHPKGHMGFGRGRHFCVGATLARLEARVAIEETLRRFPEWEVDETGLQRVHTSTVRGYSHVPIRY